MRNNKCETIWLSSEVWGWWILPGVKAMMHLVLIWGCHDTARTINAAVNEDD